MKVECKACGHVGEPKTKGSLLITFILAWFMLIPAIFYEIWRRSGGKVCRNCGSNIIVVYREPPKPIEPAKHTPSKLVSNDLTTFNTGKTSKFDENGVEQKQCPDCMEYIRIDAKKCKHCGNTNLD